MSLHLQKFIDRVTSQDLRGQKDFIMSMAEAKAIHADITKLLLELSSLKEKSVIESNDQTITVQVTGGGFK